VALSTQVNLTLVTLVKLAANPDGAAGAAGADRSTVAATGVEVLVAPPVTLTAVMVKVYRLPGTVTMLDVIAPLIAVP
jgi:hypothetical protein